MNPLLLYILLLKATLTSFSGLTSLPIVRHDLVVERKILTDRQLNTAVAASSISPGANGIYLVSVGYMAAGGPGAVAGWLAMITPSFLIIGLLRLLQTAFNHPRMEAVVKAVSLSAAGLILATSLSLAQDAIQSWFTALIAVASFILLVRFKLDPLWIMLGAAIAGLVLGLI
jgi:chromate transporter